MKVVDVIIPTLGKVNPKSHPFICFENLHHIPWRNWRRENIHQLLS